MTTTGGRAADTGLAPAYAAVRARWGLVLALVAIALVGWIWTVRTMDGMDAGPWTGLGGLAWFLGVWVVMMVAMMFGSVAPTVALFTTMTRTRSRAAPWLFVGGYLLVWSVAGLIAYAVGAIVTAVFGDRLTWPNAGHVLTALTLLVAAAYEVTPLKRVCLVKCRSPLGSLLGSWRDGPGGAVRMGVRNGAWCLGCCWALMASLFALGVMSVSWMAFVAAIIAAEKLIPWRHVPAVTAVLLVGIALVLLLAPDLLPGLTIPADDPMRMG